MVRAKTSFAKTREIVLSAVRKLMNNTGWTSRTIIKFIKTEYGLGDPKMSRKVSRALKRGVKLGLLQMERGKYRLNDLSSASRSAGVHWPQSVKPKNQQRKHARHIRERALFVRRLSSNFS